MFKRYLWPALLLFCMFTILTGAIYPVFVTGVSHLLFPVQSHGSVIYRNGLAVGSSLIGQEFEDPRYLWGRISATSPRYNASGSSGSNIGPANPALVDEVKERIASLKSSDPDNTLPIPIDLVTSSGSGLDPHISRAAAYYQAARIARKRNITVEAVKAVIDRNTQGRSLGIIGEPVVNVLKVNLDLDEVRK